MPKLEKQKLPLSFSSATTEQMGQGSMTLASGYSVYSKTYKEKKKTNTLGELYPALPDKKYEIIYADPPWDYNGKMQFDNSSKGIDKIDMSKNIFISSAVFKYPTLKLAELKKLDVPSIANDNCLLFMWTSNPHLAQAIGLAKAWGFEYKTVAFVWDKLSHNPGQYTMSNCELCLLFKKGKIPTPRGARNIQQLVKVKRTKHSAKPAEIRDNIEKMFPTQKKIELFARQAEPINKECQLIEHSDAQLVGWESWGVEA